MLIRGVYQFSDEMYLNLIISKIKDRFPEICELFKIDFLELSNTFHQNRVNAYINNSGLF